MVHKGINLMFRLEILFNSNTEHRMYFKYMFLTLYFTDSLLATIFRDDTSFAASFENIHKSMSLNNPFQHFNVTMLQYCLMGCIQYKSCKSVNYQSSLNICELNNKSLEDGVTLIDREKWDYIESVNYKTFCQERNPCNNHGLCKHSHLDYTCICNDGYFGQNCEFIKIEDFAIDFKKQITTGILYKEIILDEGLSAATICFWIYHRFISTQCAFNIYVSSNICNGFSIWLKDQDYEFLVSRQNIIFGGFNNNEWQHVCVTWAYNGKMIAYVNGKQLLSVASKGSAAIQKKPGTARISLGQDTDKIDGKCVYNDINQSFLGNISQFYMWNRALTVTDIKELYQMTIIPSNGILVNWRDFKGKADGFKHVEVPFKM